MKFLLKIYTAMPRSRWNLKKKVSGNNGTLISYMDLPLNIMYLLKYEESPNNYTDSPTKNIILQHLLAAIKKQNISIS